MKNYSQNFNIRNKEVGAKSLAGSFDKRLGNLLIFGMLISSITVGFSNAEAASSKQPAAKEIENKHGNDIKSRNEISEYRNPFDHLSKEMDRLWHKIAIRDNSGYIIDGAFVSSSFHSYLNATEKEYVLNIEIPGFEKDQVKIELQGDYIVIKAQKPSITSPAEDCSSNSQLRNSFHQKLLVPKDVDKLTISSSLKNGVLTITLPKSPVKTEEVKLIPIS